MTHHTTDRILYALYCFSRDTCHIDATELARTVGVSATQAAEALVALERAGLVDATRARLTMPGLARAAAMTARGSGGPAINMAHARPRAQAAEAATAPLAARAVAPANLHDGKPEPDTNDAHNALRSKVTSAPSER
jgi:DNA-binding IclR family transcriptional regulator